MPCAKLTAPRAKGVPKQFIHDIYFCKKNQIICLFDNFQALDDGKGGGGSHTYLIFIADNVLMVEEWPGRRLTISINRIPLEIGAVFFNEAVSFVPCFRYTDGGQDVVLFTSPNIHYKVKPPGSAIEKALFLGVFLCSIPRFDKYH